MDINSLESLDLKSASDEQVKDAINSIGKIAGISFKVHSGRAIYRSLKMSSDEELYSTKERVSYNPRPSDYGRCNLPEYPVFYGSITTQRNENEPKTDIASDFNSKSHGYLINLFECSDLIGDLDKEGVETYTIGMWRAQQEFEVPVIIDTNPANVLAHEFKKGYDNWLGTMDQDKASYFGHVSNFLCNEFSKDVPQGEEDEYKFTANYTDILLQKNMNGIMYPSVKTKREGFNIALNADLINNKVIELERVARIKVYKGLGETVLLNWELNAEFSNGSPLDYQPVPSVTLPDEVLSAKLTEMGMSHLLNL